MLDTLPYNFMSWKKYRKALERKKVLHGVDGKRKPLSWELGVMQKASRYILIKPHTRGPKFPHRVECVRQPNGFVVVS